MKVPVGSSRFVERELEKKLTELDQLVSLLSEMPDRQGAFVLLRSCASNCKIVHLLRTLPPRDSLPLAKKFDAILRRGLEAIAGHKLEDVWWRISRLPVKFGGLGLRSGVTAAAQFTQSVST